MTKKVQFDKDVLLVAGVAKALSHPARVHIMKKLTGMHACCYSGDLVDELPIGRSALSQHLKELKHAGLIQSRMEAPYIKYCLHKENWKKLKDILGAYLGHPIELLEK